MRDAPRRDVNKSERDARACIVSAEEPTRSERDKVWRRVKRLYTGLPWKSGKNRERQKNLVWIDPQKHEDENSDMER